MPYFYSWIYWLFGPLLLSWNGSLNGGGSSRIYLEAPWTFVATSSNYLSSPWDHLLIIIYLDDHHRVPRTHPLSWVTGSNPASPNSRWNKEERKFLESIHKISLPRKYMPRRHLSHRNDSRMYVPLVHVPFVRICALGACLLQVCPLWACPSCLCTSRACPTHMPLEP